MGEYVKFRGDSVKLGTCEDLYYTRFEQLEAALPEMEETPGNLNPAGYLDPSCGWRYRFPFPDEDGKYEIGDYPEYDRGLPILLPEGHEAINESPQGHGGNWFAFGAHTAGQVSFEVPCPADPAFAALGLKTARHLGEGIPIGIIQQKQMEDGSLWTVCRCGWCGGKYRLPLSEAEALAVHLREYAHGDKERTAFYHEVADRMLAGYERRTAPTPEAAAPEALKPAAPPRRSLPARGCSHLLRRARG